MSFLGFNNSSNASEFQFGAYCPEIVKKVSGVTIVQKFTTDEICNIILNAELSILEAKKIDVAIKQKIYNLEKKQSEANQTERKLRKKAKVLAKKQAVKNDISREIVEAVETVETVEKVVEKVEKTLEPIKRNDSVISNSDCSISSSKSWADMSEEPDYCEVPKPNNLKVPTNEVTYAKALAKDVSDQIARSQSAPIAVATKVKIEVSPSEELPADNNNYTNNECKVWDKLAYFTQEQASRANFAAELKKVKTSTVELASSCKIDIKVVSECIYGLQKKGVILAYKEDSINGKQFKRWYITDTTLVELDDGYRMTSAAKSVYDLLNTIYYNDFENGKFTPYDENVIDILQKSGQSTILELSNLTGIPYKVVQAILGQLRADEMVSFLRSDNDTYWCIIAQEQVKG